MSTSKWNAQYDIGQLLITSGLEHESLCSDSAIRSLTSAGKVGEHSGEVLKVESSKAPTAHLEKVAQ